MNWLLSFMMNSFLHDVFFHISLVEKIRFRDTALMLVGGLFKNAFEELAARACRPWLVSDLERWCFQFCKDDDMYCEILVTPISG